jgi:excisionase family DNA binding protein
LGTREVAELLTVSEASVRRWSDAGLLPVERVGRRGERRFRESDVRRFLEKGRRQGPAGVMLGGTPLAVGAHVATFYDNDAARLRLTIPFLADGLRQGQACLLVAAGSVLESYLSALRAQEGLDLDRSLSSSLLVTHDALGKTSDEASSRFQELAWSAIARSSGLLRVVGEMVFAVDATQEPARELLRFEEGLNSTIRRLPAVVVCQFDVREFDGITILGAIKSHPDTFEMNQGLLIG